MQTAEFERSENYRCVMRKNKTSGPRLLARDISRIAFKYFKILSQIYEQTCLIKRIYQKKTAQFILMQVVINK